MTIVNHECYVSLEVAKLLKEAGFDWKCLSAYFRINDEVYKFWQYANDRPLNWNKSTGGCSAPTLDVVQRWVREVKGYYIEIVTHENKRCVTNSDGQTFHYEYDKSTFVCDIINERCENISSLDDLFNTYEEAQEAGIKKTLEIILERGE